MKLQIKKPTKAQVRHFLHHCLIVVAGNFITASASAFFIIPNNLTMGGTTGLGIFIGKFWENEFAISLVVYIANIILFLLGAFLLGKKFAAATLAGTLLYPTFMSLFTRLNNLYMEAHGGPVTGDDTMLAAIFGSLLFGLGIALVVRIGASTGGTDIPPMIFNKYFGWSIALGLWLVDTVIIILQAFVFAIDSVLYGFLITILSSIVIDFVSPIGMKRTQVKIISKKYREIRKMILTKLNRGVTVLYGQTGYLKEKCFVILTIVNNRELVKLKNEVQKIDPESFMTISVVSEVRGRGFTSEGIRLPQETEDLTEVQEVSPAPAQDSKQ